MLSGPREPIDGCCKRLLPKVWGLLWKGGELFKWKKIKNSADIK